MSPFILILIVIFVVAPLAGAIAKRLESGSAGPSPLPEGMDPERLERLEGQIEVLAERVRELAEHQEFLTRLLEGTPPGGRSALTEDGDR
jgi:hypothetical protein